LAEADVDLDQTALEFLGEHVLAKPDEDVGVEASLRMAFGAPSSKALLRERLGAPGAEREIPAS